MTIHGRRVPPPPARNRHGSLAPLGTTPHGSTVSPPLAAYRHAILTPFGTTLPARTVHPPPCACRRGRGFEHASREAWPPFRWSRRGGAWGPARRGTRAP